MTGPSPLPPLTPEAVRTDVARVLGEDPSSIGDDDDLIDLGLDSIRLMALAERWRRSGFEVDFAAFAERATVGAWWALIAAADPPSADGRPGGVA